MLTVTKDTHDDKMILFCEGRLDATTTPQLERVLQELVEGNQHLVRIDFHKVEYLSSAGLRTLLAFTKKLKSQGGGLVLSQVHDDVMDIISMGGFDHILSIHSTGEEAEKALDETSGNNANS